MIDYNEWAREEMESADNLRSMLTAYFPVKMIATALVEERIAMHEERAKFLARMAERAQIGIW